MTKKQRNLRPASILRLACVGPIGVGLHTIPFFPPQSKHVFEPAPNTLLVSVLVVLVVLVTVKRWPVQVWVGRGAFAFALVPLGVR